MALDQTILQAAIRSQDLAEFWEVVLPIIAREVRCHSLAVVRSDKGEWIVDASTRPKTDLAADLLAEGLDRGGIVTSGNAFVALIPQAGDLLLLGELESAPNAQSEGQARGTGHGDLTGTNTRRRTRTRPLAD